MLAASCVHRLRDHTVTTICHWQCPVESGKFRCAEGASTIKYDHSTDDAHDSIWPRTHGPPPCLSYHNLLEYSDCGAEWPRAPGRIRRILKHLLGVTRRQFETPGTAEEHKRQETPTINSNDRQPTQVTDQAPGTIERAVRDSRHTTVTKE